MEKSNSFEGNWRRKSNATLTSNSKNYWDLEMVENGQMVIRRREKPRTEIMRSKQKQTETRREKFNTNRK